MKYWKILLISIAGAGLMAGTVNATPKYVGNSGCKCHKSELADWEKSKHAKAFDLLEAGKKGSKKKKANLDPDLDYTSSNKCLKCHVTGYKEEGGFVSASATPDLASIGCEMCHGPGSEYRAIHKEKTTKFTRAEVKAAGQLYGSLDVSVCKTCHEHKDNPFKPELDADYKLNLEEALNDSRAFHKLYPLEGKH